MPQPKQSSKVLELKGAFKKDPQRKPKNEPVPSGPIGAPPTSLNAREKRVFLDIVQACPPGVLTNADEMTVVAASRLEAEWRRTGNDMPSAKIGQLIKCLGLLGMNPADRSRISLADHKPDNEWDGV